MLAHFETFGGFDAVEDRCNCQIACITGPDHTWFYVMGGGFLFIFVSCGIYAWTRGGACDNDIDGQGMGGIPGGGQLVQQQTMNGNMNGDMNFGGQ